jgi:hypothetical protein
MWQEFVGIFIQFYVPDRASTSNICCHITDNRGHISEGLLHLALAAFTSRLHAILLEDTSS